MRGQGGGGNRLAQELTTPRQRIAELEALHAGRERAEEALRKSEATARALLESAAEGSGIVGSDGRFGESGQLEDAIAPLLRSICEGLGWELGELWYVDPATKVLRWGGIWHAPSLDVAEFEGVRRQIPLSPGGGFPRPAAGP